MIWRRPALWAAALALAGGVLRAQFVHFKTDLHPDERIVAGLVAADRQTGRLSANWACLEDPDYGRPTYQFSAYSLAVELAARAGRALTDHPADAGEAIRLGRWISCTCGAASLFLLFLAGRNLAGPAVGFLAQVFLLVAFLHVQDSGYARPEGMLSFAITFALWLWTRARFRPTVASWLCFGAAAGLAIAVKYSAAPLLLLLPLNRRAFVALLGLGAGFLLGTPEVLVDPAPLLAGIRFEAEHYRAGHIPHQSSGAWDFNALWYANYLCQLGWGWVPALLAAAFLLTPRLPSPDAQRLRLFAFAALFMIALPKVRFERNLEVALPALAIAAAWQVQLFRSRFAGLPPRLGRVLVLAALVFAAAQSSLALVRYRQAQRFHHSPLVALPARAHQPDVLRLHAWQPPPANWDHAPALVISAFTDPWSARGLAEWTERLKGWDTRKFDSPWRAHGYPFSTVEVYHGPARVLFATPPTAR